MCKPKGQVLYPDKLQSDVNSKIVNNIIPYYLAVLLLMTPVNCTQNNNMTVLEPSLVD